MPNSENLTNATTWRAITMKPVFVRLERRPNAGQPAPGAQPSDASPG